jgi:hypothetical protein
MQNSHDRPGSNHFWTHSFYTTHLNQGSRWCLKLEVNFVQATTMDANENPEADQDDVEAVVVLPSGERIPIRSMEQSHWVRFRQADGEIVDISFAIVDGSLSLTLATSVGPEDGPVVNIRDWTGDADSHARQKHVDLVRNGATEVDLTKPEWLRGNPDDIRSCREELLSALEVDRTLTTVTVGHRFLANLEEMEQRRVFRVILERPSLCHFSVLGSSKSTESIHTSALLDTMTEGHSHLQTVTIRNVRLKNRFEVEQLASALRARGGGFQELALVGLVSIAEEHPLGFLDPLLEAMLTCHQPNYFSLRGYVHKDVHPSGRPSLVTPTALRSYLEAYAHFTQPYRCSMRLENLGLEDEHCKVIAELLASMNDQYPGRALDDLWVGGNGAIGDEGYEALLGLLNRNHCIETIKVDDSSWQETFDLVVHMNTKYGRGEFIEDGVFAEKDGWVHWLAKLTNLPSTQDEAEEMLRANALWYTLRNEPCFISN